MKKNIKLFGCEPSYHESEVILLAVPWSVTSSFGKGAELGPYVVAHNSSQMDFFSIDGEDIRDKGIYLQEPPDFLKTLNQHMRGKALPVVKLEEGAPGNFPKKKMDEINEACARMVKWVYEETKQIHLNKKKVGLIGGDHSISEGAVRYFSEVYQGDFGILHIDAHADLRKTYQGFQYSHASVMYNIMHQEYVPVSLVQVGVRDYSKEEYMFIQNKDHIHTFFDSKIKADIFEGKTWGDIVQSIISLLPKRVYISLDVDGLKPHLFPHTGTPVPGGLDFEEVDYLLTKLLKRHHQIIGFDLVEMASPHGECDLWDSQPGARLLYKLSQMLIRSN